MAQSQVAQKNIFIKNHDLGFFTQTEITVQRRERDIDEPAEFNLVWCNHAQAEIETVENEIINPNGLDIVWNVQVLVCRCGAYRHDGDPEWHDAPESGLYMESDRRTTI